MVFKNLGDGTLFEWTLRINNCHILIFDAYLIFFNEFNLNLLICNIFSFCLEFSINSFHLYFLFNDNTFNDDRFNWWWCYILLLKFFFWFNELNFSILLCFFLHLLLLWGELIWFIIIRRFVLILQVWIKKVSFSFFLLLHIWLQFVDNHVINSFIMLFFIFLFFLILLFCYFLFLTLLSLDLNCWFLLNHCLIMNFMIWLIIHSILFSLFLFLFCNLHFFIGWCFICLEHIHHVGLLVWRLLFFLVNSLLLLYLFNLVLLFKHLVLEIWEHHSIIWLFLMNCHDFWLIIVHLVLHFDVLSGIECCHLLWSWCPEILLI